MTAGHGPGNAGLVYSYNLDPATTPGGLKVRWRVRIATGAEAERLDIIQQEAILKLLAWADGYLKAQGKTGTAAPEIRDGNSPETITNDSE